MRELVSKSEIAQRAANFAPLGHNTPASQAAVTFMEANEIVKAAASELVQKWQDTIDALDRITGAGVERECSVLRDCIVQTCEKFGIEQPQPESLGRQALTEQVRGSGDA